MRSDFGRLVDEVGHEGRIATEDELPKSEEMGEVWNRTVSRATFEHNFDAFADMTCWSRTKLINIVHSVEECIP